MRLSDERIDFISQQILDSLVEKRLVKIKKARQVALNELIRVISTDISFEDKIDKEIEDMIRSMKRDIPEGSSEWKAIFIQKKDELMHKYNYII